MPEQTAAGTFMRIAAALQTAGVFFQAVTAGLLLSTEYGEALHGAGARGMYAASMLYVLAAVLGWRPGGGPVRPVLYAAGMLVLASAQVVLGIARVASVHVPLGVLMFGLSVLLLGHSVVAGRLRGRTAPAV
ncbi:hypothetical protein EF912_27200 [Streptomyces sp. WAC07061]|uniref:hypothetical protein n=1 Tax=Streptomyces sp. WAC07061 TaxID=2487410 RepID=UPI000F785D0C|nr:hypothetical protein [Streptomyces sp. WAC07061]RSS46902.1 hypothetical protein EF912_27200 [Streptomyces sp. WAC07061]